MSGRRGAVVKNPWGDGRDAAVCDHLCSLRPCLNVGENKGTYTPGRGYTSYHAKPKLACLTRDYHGCPHPLPDPVPELARCCLAPDVPTWKRTHSPAYQTCRRCRTRLSGHRLELVRTLPQLPHVDCEHVGVRRLIWTTGDGPWKCRACESYWLRKPERFKPGGTLEEFGAERRAQEEQRRESHEKYLLRRTAPAE